MKTSYPIPARESRAEITVVNSRFIATVTPAFSVDEARQFIARMRAEFSDASHNVPAFIIGGGSSVITHCSDDGEPSGTAGRPALAVLSGSGLGDAAAVITRYFGGTKLGTGGLVHAYSESMRTVLNILPRAIRVPTHTVMLVLPYNWLERVRLLAPAHQGQILDEDFGADITLTLRFAIDRFDGFQHALLQASNGQLQAEIIESGQTIMPLENSAHHQE